MGLWQWHLALDGEQMSDEKAIVIDLDGSPGFQRLLAGVPQTCGMKSGRVYLELGEEVGQHSTNQREEMLIFLSGTGQLIIEQGQTFHIGKGKISYIPPNTQHNIKNTGSEPLIYIYCVAPVAGRLT
jgi:mannose-6-phosphate isomerase-like protein (cupin superfamily)